MCKYTERKNSNLLKYIQEILQHIYKTDTEVHNVLVQVFLSSMHATRVVLQYYYTVFTTE